MNLVLANDNVTADALENLAPHKNSLSLNRLKTLTSASSLPKPVASTIANWLYYPRQVSGDPVKMKFLQDISEPA